MLLVGSFSSIIILIRILELGPSIFPLAPHSRLLNLVLIVVVVLRLLPEGALELVNGTAEGGVKVTRIDNVLSTLPISTTHYLHLRTGILHLIFFLLLLL